MSDKIFLEPDPMFELMGLNYVSYHLEEIKEETKQSITNLGYDGEEFYSMNFQIYDEYVQAFMKHMNKTKEKDFYFEESSFDFFPVLWLILLEYRSMIQADPDCTNEQINARIRDILREDLEKQKSSSEDISTKDMVEFLEICNLNGNAKWKLLQLMQNPKDYIGQLYELIQGDMEAYKKAVKAVKPALDRLLKQYDIWMKSGIDKKFEDIKRRIVVEAEIFPTLVFPGSQIVSEKKCYYGLLSEKLTNGEESNSQSKEVLLQKLKALSDNSKLEILLALKEKPMYNLEIAKQLGLSAATMSHHMNVLLYCGFVTVEKKEGKVYYCVNEASQKKFIEELQTILLSK